jgi:hypothetical protein
MSANGQRPDPARDRLVELLPVVHRARDAELGEPLATLLRLIAEQVAVVSDDIDQLYRNWFIETCADWVVPYIGDLVGFHGSPVGSPQSLPPEVAAPRRDVADTVLSRRAKGTLAVLERIARDAAGWPAHAVEFYRLLAVHQSINHLHLDRGRVADLRDGDALENLEGPFDRIAHSIAVQRINSRHTRARHNIPSVGLFVWRLKPYPLTKRSPAFCIDRARSHYTFSVLGNDVPLITRPVPASQAPGHPELTVPAWITRRALARNLDRYYGPQLSLAIAVGDPHAWVARERIVAADLSDWSYRPKGDQVAVDPVRGRIKFAVRHSPDTGVWVVYHYGFSADIGGGEYRRALRPAGERHVYPVAAGSPEPGPPYASLPAAIRQWEADKAEDPSRRDAIIEIADSDAYEDALEIRLDDGDRLELRAAQRARPVVRLLDFRANRPDSLRVIGPTSGPQEVGDEEPPEDADGRPCESECRHRARLVLDGLLISGRGVRVTGEVGEVVVRHCTLVPGWELGHDCEPEDGSEPSIEIDGPTERLVLDHSIVGSILVDRDEVRTEPLDVWIGDSVLDATEPGFDAIGASDGRHAHAAATIVRSTVVGRVRTNGIRLAENAIFVGIISTIRRQEGCMRYCSLTLPARTPRRHQCQPDLVRAAAVGTAADDEEVRVRPQFDSLRYGTPGYCRLAQTCAIEITQGADDESEMGVFHDLFEPQREASLRARLDEFTPAGTDAGIIFVT